MKVRLNIKRAAGVALALGTSPAWAGAGDHIRAGSATLAPELDLGFAYDTNVYRAAADPVAGGHLAISPKVDLGVDTEQNEFALGGQWDLRKYLFLDTDSPVRSDLIRAVDRFNDFEVSAALDLLKQESVGLVLKEQVALRNNETDRGVVANPFMTQVRNRLEGGVRVSPGQALDIVPGGAWAYDDFRVADAEAFRTRFNSRHTYGPTLDTRWDFFPRTALVLRGEGMWHWWQQNDVPYIDPFTGATGVLAVPDSVHVKVQGGLEGRFTERIYVDLVGGYGTTSYDPSSVGSVPSDAANVRGTDGIIGTVQVRYKVVREGERSLEMGLGYQRDFLDSFFTNYVVYDQFQVQAGANIGGIRPRVTYGLRLEGYSGAIVRDDVLNRLEGELGYQFRDWGKIAASTTWQQRAIVQTAYQTAEYDAVTIALTSTWTY